MDVVDPRDTEADLVEARETARVDADRFAELRSTEAFTAGWVAGGAVVDHRDRLLLIQDTEGTWLLPGGSVKPGETLAAATKREIREETGVEIEPRRPVGLRETVVRHGSETVSFRFVVHSATATATTIADQLGTEDEQIARASWVETLPTPLFQRDFYERLLARIPDWNG